MSISITADSVTYTTGKVTLLHEVSLRVGGGELVAIIGPNGAGKSTLLRVLAGDWSPGRGSVLLTGDDVTDLDHGALALRRAVLPQHRTADIPFTAREVVAMGRHPHRRDAGNSAAADREAVARAMTGTATTAVGDRVYATLSGGEQARVSIARVLAQNAPILLLDEPTAALDVAHEERVMRELRARAASGTAVVAVLHDLNAAARYASRVILMSGGRIAASGAPADVLTGDRLSSVYEHPMRVVPHPFLDCPLVLVAD